MASLGRHLIAVGLAVALVLSTALPVADAGGSWMYPVKDRYEPGESVTMVGYFGGGAYGPVADEPYYAFLRLLDDTDSVIGEELPVGELEISKVAFQWRAAISFDLPTELPPGRYLLDYCTAGCERRVGDLIGGFLSVGVDAEYSPSRPWPPDEPEIENLADDVKLWVAGIETTAAAVRSGVWVPQPTRVAHNDYPPTTPTPVASVEVASTESTRPPEPASSPTPRPSATSTPAVAPPEMLFVDAESGFGEPVFVAAGASTGLAGGSVSTPTMLLALVATGALTIAGRHVLRRRDQPFER